MIQKKKKISVHRSARWVSGLGIVVLAIMFAGVSAKYTQKETKVDNTISNEFYFTSTLLSETGTTYTLMPTTTELDIPVCNYADDLRYSAGEIQYSYSVTKDNAEVSNGDGNIGAGKLQTGTISLTDLKPGTYLVTATANSPFQKVLKGTFIIPKESIELHYSVTDKEGSPYVLLNVWTDDYNGKVKLTWPEGVIPDSTNEQLKNVVTYTSDAGSYPVGNTTVSCEAYGSKVYRFFKVNPERVYIDGQFIASKTTE